MTTERKNTETAAPPSAGSAGGAISSLSASPVRHGTMPAIWCEDQVAKAETHDEKIRAVLREYAEKKELSARRLAAFERESE